MVKIYSSDSDSELSDLDEILENDLQEKLPGKPIVTPNSKSPKESSSDSPDYEDPKKQVQLNISSQKPALSPKSSVTAVDSSHSTDSSSKSDAESKGPADKIPPTKAAASTTSITIE